MTTEALTIDVFTLSALLEGIAPNAIGFVGDVEGEEGEMTAGKGTKGSEESQRSLRELYRRAESTGLPNDRTRDELDVPVLTISSGELGIIRLV